MPEQISVVFILEILGRPKEHLKNGFPNASVLNFEYEEGQFKLVDVFIPEL